MKRCPRRNFQLVGELVEQRRARLIHEKFVPSARASSGLALVVAALLDEMPADELMVHAIARFLGIQWTTLAQNVSIITDGGLIRDIGAGVAHLYHLSGPCKLGGCDVFWSHSWSDYGDGDQQLQAVKN